MKYIVCLWKEVVLSLRYALMFPLAPKMAYELEAAWYAMSKYAPRKCSREIKSAERLLVKIGYIRK